MLRYGRKVDVRLPSRDSYYARCDLILLFYVFAASVLNSCSSLKRTRDICRRCSTYNIIYFNTVRTDCTHRDPAPGVPDCEIKTGEKILQTPRTLGV